VRFGVERLGATPLRLPDGTAAQGAAGLAEPVDEALAPLLTAVRMFDAKADMSMIERAFAVARDAHRDQKRDNGEPYINHPLAVAGILAGYRLDTASIITALLHDTVEDTGLKLPEVQRRFGAEVAGLVDGVTKLTQLELQSDRTKQAENFRKLVLAMSRDIRVLLVKLADRLHNMRTLKFVQQADRRQRIARETMEIYAPLAERIGMDAMKSELQTLAFAQLEPEAYDTIQNRLNFLRGQGADLIEEVKRDLRRTCESSEVAVVEVSGREKSPYSIWEKMKRRNVQFEQLSDIMAFRIVVPTREACYAALGAVHAGYPVVAGRFKDYISTPKSNGYQSLHTGVTLREPRNQRIEVQIRTPDMADVAENGLAAHWSYKHGDMGLAVGEAQRFPWVRDLLEILDNSAPEEFLTNTKLELYPDTVFCFTPKGQLIQLPRGATTVDFAYAVHSEVGDRCVGAKVNGRLMPLRYVLQNGDQVEIMTSRGGTPSAQWERFVVTGKARARIRRWVQAQQRQQYLDTGRAALVKAFRQAGLDGSEKVLEPALKGLKQASLPDLYTAVGNGNLTTREVLTAVYPELREPPRAPRMLPNLPRSETRTATGRSADVPINGLLPGVPYQFAGCCHALAGDPIVGIINNTKGVTIHTKDCPTLESFAAEPARFMELDWDSAAFATTGKPPRDRGTDGHIGRIAVVADNHPNAMAAIANAVSKHEGTLSSLRTINRQPDFFEVLVDVEVRDVRHLATVIAGLRAASGVRGVERARG
jgi:guanosine-3',5'-bis(diphosphate) 3'-pyrophosphohydrolase